MRNCEHAFAWIQWRINDIEGHWYDEGILFPLWKSVIMLNISYISKIFLNSLHGDWYDESSIKLWRIVSNIPRRSAGKKKILEQLLFLCENFFIRQPYVRNVARNTNILDNNRIWILYCMYYMYLCIFLYMYVYRTVQYNKSSRNNNVIIIFITYKWRHKCSDVGVGCGLCPHLNMQKIKYKYMNLLQTYIYNKNDDEEI